MFIQLLNLLGSGFYAAAMIMPRMIPLRIMLLIGNAFYIAYSLSAREYALFALYLVMFPLNFYRLRQMLGLIRKVERASDGVIRMDWLSAFMQRRPIKAGASVFKRGDGANELFYVATGRFQIPELGVELKPGSVVGEIGLLAPGRGRTQSLSCLESGDLLVMTYDEFNELYFQNPEFGYHFLRLVANRLLANQDRLERELATRTAP